MDYYVFHAYPFHSKISTAAASPLPPLALAPAPAAVTHLEVAVGVSGHKEH